MENVLNNLENTTLPIFAVAFVLALLCRSVVEHRTLAQRMGQPITTAFLGVLKLYFTMLAVVSLLVFCVNHLVLGTLFEYFSYNVLLNIRDLLATLSQYVVPMDSIMLLVQGGVVMCIGAVLWVGIRSVGMARSRLPVMTTTNSADFQRMGKVLAKLTQVVLGLFFVAVFTLSGHEVKGVRDNLTNTLSDWETESRALGSAIKMLETAESTKAIASLLIKYCDAGCQKSLIAYNDKLQGHAGARSAVAAGAGGINALEYSRDQWRDSVSLRNVRTASIRVSDLLAASNERLSAVRLEGTSRRAIAAVALEVSVLAVNSELGKDRRGRNKFSRAFVKLTGDVRGDLEVAGLDQGFKNRLENAVLYDHNSSDSDALRIAEAALISQLEKRAEGILESSGASLDRLVVRYRPHRS